MRRKSSALLLGAACNHAADAPAATLLADNGTATADPDTSSSTTDEPTPTSSTAPAPDPTTTTTDTTTTGAASTTEAASTTASSSTSETTGPLVGCGNGVDDPGEECDDGDENSDNGHCTLHCKINTCGDGLVGPGEQCDSGPKNMDNTYNVCGHNCHFGPHCGDGIQQPEEECDFGEKNGTDQEPIDGVPCTQSCDHVAALVFLSDAAFTVTELGSPIYNIDKHCQKLAADAGLWNAADFKAWISVDNGDVKGRWKPEIDGLPYALLNGKKIADSRTALFQLGPITGITRTEKGATLLDAWVWTDTNQDGTLFDPALDCDGWQSENPVLKARVGRSGVDETNIAAFTEWKTNQQWTSHVMWGCDYKFHLYCFED